MVGTLREKGMISVPVDGVVPDDHPETVPPQADKSSVEIEAALQTELVAQSKSFDFEPIRKLEHHVQLSTRL